ncbi:hypothetical protein A2272_05010 [Candidatus Peregrinibacteria bacterium RIFOXYA12_FULL_33_12]|nr:MAG: hypothetical protein A2272_05010 [Candidatus Peregrinibacteria bacterium RIFOXYA12_FULL_33_12]
MISKDLLNLFQIAKKNKASDLYLSTNSRSMLRVNGELNELSEARLDKKTIETYVKSFLSKEEQEILMTESCVDLNLEIENEFRLRINIFIQSNGLTAIFHLIPLEIPEFDSLNLPKHVKNICGLKSGLVLFAGPSGSGKSTTMASIINEINQNQKSHIITFEDPIEFRFKNIKSIISQREIGKHIQNYEQIAKQSIRANPDVIAIGEIRDSETIKLASILAETGHLILATIHAASVVNVINRIGPQLSDSLMCVICQRLMKTKKASKRFPACEILIHNEQIATLIRQNKLHQIQNVLQFSQTEGMQTFEQGLRKVEMNNINLQN